MATIDFKSTIENLRYTGFNPQPDKVFIHVPDAKGVLKRGLDYFTGKGEWLKEYDEIVDWLTDNKGRGLLVYGNCGRGKTLIL